MALRNDWRHPVPPKFLAPPTFSECVDVLRMWLSRADAGREVLLAEDIETARGFITCLGFADSSQFAMSIPFIRINPDRSFSSWWNVEEEATIVGLIHRINSHGKIGIVGQNFIYDTQYIEHWLAATPTLFWDTMLAQNVLFPGTPKGLDYLSSLYCKYHWYWKEDHKEWDLRGTIEDLLVYNCWDCVRTFEVGESQLKVMDDSGLAAQMRLKMKTAELCLRMMRRGIRVDLPKRGRVSFELEAASHELAKELEEIIPQDWVSPGNKTPWYRSDTQTRYLFYDRLGFAVQKIAKRANPLLAKKPGSNSKEIPRVCRSLRATPPLWKV
jgi:DNA polymerase I-like protein with 3'-5' exonuclease and polymerase domains